MNKDYTELSARKNTSILMASSKTVRLITFVVIAVVVSKVNAEVNTVDGGVCVFPFIYQGKTYESCTTVNHNRPWCSKTANYDENPQWGNCEGVNTLDGGLCVFPFIYQGKTYESCTKENHNRPWCSKTANYDENQQWGDCEGGRTLGGQFCVFPFIYQGQKYYSCTRKNSNRPWCAIYHNIDLLYLWDDCVDEEFARAHIPQLRFDGGAGKYCYPDEALDSNDNQCKGFNSNAPIYYDIRDCDNYRKLVWWFWYGYQKNCDCCSGSHGDDWEHITINFIKNGGSYTQDSVTWYQHDGWYTRSNTDTNPVVYVGKIGHGSYDNWCDGKGFSWEQDYCPGGCGYWNDFRNDNANTHWTPHNIKPLTSAHGNVWDRVEDERYFRNTDLNGCAGGNWRCVKGPCGCWRGSHTFPATQCDT